MLGWDQFPSATSPFRDCFRGHPPKAHESIILCKIGGPRETAGFASQLNNMCISVVPHDTAFFCLFDPTSVDLPVSPGIAPLSGLAENGP
jgi:hypothetical protein